MVLERLKEDSFSVETLITIISRLFAVLVYEQVIKDMTDLPNTILDNIQGMGLENLIGFHDKVVRLINIALEVYPEVVEVAAAADLDAKLGEITRSKADMLAGNQCLAHETVIEYYRLIRYIEIRIRELRGQV